MLWLDGILLVEIKIFLFNFLFIKLLIKNLFIWVINMVDMDIIRIVLGIVNILYCYYCNNIGNIF